MKDMLNLFIQFDGYLFLLIGIIVLIIPSPQPGLIKKVNNDDLLPFSQTRRLLASMFISSGLLLIVVGRNITDPQTLQLTSIVRIISFLLVIVLNAIQYQSKRWKAAPLIALMSLFSFMSLIYLYFLIA